jgi:NAD(P)H-hydrate epimerase
VTWQGVNNGPRGKDTTMTNEELAALLLETGQHHHQAFIESDGADPEWALWYAAHLQTKIWDSFGSVPTRSKLVHVLIDGDERIRAGETTEAWSTFYAQLISDALSAS